MGRSFLVVTICAALVAGLAAAPASAAKGKRAKGKVAVTVSTPKGVPANVLLRRGAVSRVAAKAAKGRRAKVRLSLPARRYRIAARPFAFKGRFYVGKASRRKVRVARGRTARVRVRYRRVPSASKLRPKRVTASRVALAWRGPKRARFALRRAVGSDAPTGRRKGVAVRTKGRRAVDKGLKAGTRYSYSLFTKLRGRRWTGPIAVSAGTLPRPGSTDAAFVTSPGTVLARPRDIAHATTTGDGVALRLKGSGGPPVIGTVVVLPRSAALPGGFLGRVVSIRADGTAVLAATGLDAAFDAYRIDVPRFQDAPRPVGP